MIEGRITCDRCKESHELRCELREGYVKGTCRTLFQAHYVGDGGRLVHLCEACRVALESKREQATKDFFEGMTNG
jgi:hypothetical protein